jgi:hypothetical protein
MRTIIAGGYQPINTQAGHGFFPPGQRRRHKKPSPLASVPKDGYDCTGWSQAEVEDWFRQRYENTPPSEEFIRKVALQAIKRGRIM